jgi:uncharacterized protein YcnI
VRPSELARRGAAAVLTAAVAVAWTVSAADAHVQVSPSVVAPDDAVKFTVLVPGEREAETTSVALRMPAGLLPFSYEDTPGWTRRIVSASNGGVDQVIWTGRLPRDGFVEFSFLAGTPAHPGQLAWKALQTYSDGTVVRWIGPPDADDPAPVTEVVKGAPAQNAGGENASSAPPGSATATPAAPDAAPAAAVATATAVMPAAVMSDSGTGGPDWVARGLGVAALLALGGLALELRRRDRRRALVA